ncbi:MAG TPA: hypothetical protein VGS05_03880 [Candidatus Sulfotelmatobacter sp.]|nr:hypothetical protein [Candidatus Sulfotelmatobacter sp.]
MSKPKLRARLASLSFTEKIKILEKLRERSAKIAGSGLRKDRNGRGTKRNSESGK